MPSVRSEPPRQSLYRVLSQKSVWRELWGSVKRVHKDRRARRHVGFLSLVVGLVLLLVVALIVYVMFLIGTGSILFIPVVIPLLWWIRRSANKEFQPISIAPQAAAHGAEAREANARALHTHFAELTLLYAVLVDRAGSERFLKEKELPPGVEVTSRRAHMEALRSANLWERIGPKDREALMIADGGWDWEQINRFAMGIEPLRLLRWVLRIDFRLPTIGQQLSGDFGIAHEIVVDCERLWRGRELIDADTVRSSRDDARTTLLRCIAEAIIRGYQVAADDEMAAWAKKISDDLAGNQNEDFLLGDKLVSEATREQLGWATALANIRSDFLAMVLDLLESDRPPEGAIESIFAEEDESIPEPQ
jgi:hypothetical protein